MDKLRQNLLRVSLSAHPGIGNRETTAWEMGRLLGVAVESNGFRKLSLLAIRGRQNRIQIKVIWIELERALTLANCIVYLVVREVGGGGNVAVDGRYRI